MSYKYKYTHTHKALTHLILPGPKSAKLTLFQKKKFISQQVFTAAWKATCIPFLKGQEIYFAEKNILLHSDP